MNKKTSETYIILITCLYSLS